MQMNPPNKVFHPRGVQASCEERHEPQSMAVTSCSSKDKCSPQTVQEPQNIQTVPPERKSTVAERTNAGTQAAGAARPSPLPERLPTTHQFPRIHRLFEPLAQLGPRGHHGPQHVPGCQVADAVGLGQLRSLRERTDGPCARDARAATSALAPGPGCRQAHSALHHQAGNELPARQGLETSDPQQQLRLGVLRELGVPRGAPLAARLVTREGGVGPCLLRT